MLRFVLTLLVVVVLPFPACGDGKVFPSVGIARAETPAQRAMIHWAGGIETLVIETTVRSDATNLAWVIPLPTSPTAVHPVDPGLFPTLQSVCRARVEMGTSKGWIAGLIAAALILALRWAACGRIPFRPFEVLLVLLVVLFGASMFLPALAKARAKGGTAVHEESTVQLLGATRAGVFDVTTLTAAKAGDLVAWLRERGFAAPVEIEPVLADYLDRGWVFVAARVASPEPGSLAALHPLAFTFPAPQPIYPMRLTGIGIQSLECDLYVFGPARASAPGWRVAFCARPSYDTNAPDPNQSPGLRVRHAPLASLVNHAPVATKLRATLTGQHFDRDVTLNWSPFRATGQTVYTSASVRAQAGSRAAWILAVASMLGCLNRPRTAGKVPWFTPTDKLGAVGALCTGLLTWAFLPAVPAEGVQRLRIHPSYQARHQLVQLAIEAGDTPAIRDVLRQERAPNPIEWETIRSTFAEFLRTNAYSPPYDYGNRVHTNLFSPERLRLESSPGNLTLEPATNGLDLVWHDFDGFPALREPIPRLDPPTDPPPSAQP